MNDNRDVERDALALCLCDKAEQHPVCERVSFAPQRLRVLERAKCLQLSEASRRGARRNKFSVAVVAALVVVMFVLCMVAVLWGRVWPQWERSVAFEREHREEHLLVGARQAARQEPLDIEVVLRHKGGHALHAAHEESARQPVHTAVHRLYWRHLRATQKKIET